MKLGVKFSQSVDATAALYKTDPPVVPFAEVVMVHGVEPVAQSFKAVLFFAYHAFISANALAVVRASSSGYPLQSSEPASQEAAVPSPYSKLELVNI